VDEEALFRMIQQMRHITEAAAKTTKGARRERERRKHTGVAQAVNRASPAPAPPVVPAATAPTEVPVRRFEQIEEW
jgi:putative transposase